MRYLAAILLLTMLFYMLSFASHNWRQGAKLAAVGSVILGLAACGLGFFVIFSGLYEL